MAEQPLTREQTIALFRKLEMKYKAEMQCLQTAAAQDITVYGFVTEKTKEMQAHLLERIKKEADHEVQ